MRSMTKSALAALVLLAAAATAQAAGDPEAGKQKAQPCQACHGDGNKTVDGTYPKLAGQYADYLVKSLGDYKTGARQNAIMAGFAAPLSKQDMEDLAAYYSKQPGDLEDLSHMDE